jgi:hypothetical protein
VTLEKELEATIVVRARTKRIAIFSESLPRKPTVRKIADLLGKNKDTSYRSTSDCFLHDSLCLKFTFLLIYDVTAATTTTTTTTTAAAAAGTIITTTLTTISVTTLLLRLLLLLLLLLH